MQQIVVGLLSKSFETWRRRIEVVKVAACRCGVMNREEEPMPTAPKAGCIVPIAFKKGSLQIRT
jgi:hypothetical protein